MQRLSARALRQEVGARNLQQVEDRIHEVTYGAIPSVVYAADNAGAHGNFLPASYRRICADPSWQRRLEKAYTAAERLPRSSDRRRGELECANSSDALLMNVFCYPRVLCRQPLISLLGLSQGQRPEFGVRAHLAMHNGETDRTELDMCLDDLIVESKLTESDFGSASEERLLRYLHVDEVFARDDLPRRAGLYLGYQLIRSVLAAQQTDCRFVLLCDGRRSDLQERWFQVLSAVRSYEVRSRCCLLSWQELSGTLPRIVQTYLGAKYGIVPPADTKGNAAW